jgi:hypothetical protein
MYRAIAVVVALLEAAVPSAAQVNFFVQVLTIRFFH